MNRNVLKNKNVKNFGIFVLILFGLMIFSNLVMKNTDRSSSYYGGDNRSLNSLAVDSSPTNSSSSEPPDNVDYSGGTQSKSAAESKAGDPSATPADAPDGRKFIRNGGVTIQVENVNKKVDEARALISDKNGEIVRLESRVKNVEIGVSSDYTASSSSNDYRSDKYSNSSSSPSYYTPTVGDYAIIVFTVPSDNFEKTLTDLKKLGKVLMKNSSSDEVTLEIVGTQGKIESLTKSVQTLESLLKNAKNIDEVLRIEDSISARKSELASLQEQLNSMNNQVKNSTVVLQLVTKKSAEAKPTTEEMGWWDKLWANVGDESASSVSNTIVFILSIVPLLLLAGLILLLWNFIKRVLRNNKEKFGTFDPKLSSEPRWKSSSIAYYPEDESGSTGTKNSVDENSADAGKNNNKVESKTENKVDKSNSVSEPKNKGSNGDPGAM